MCAHGPSRLAAAYLCNVREANEPTTIWINASWTRAGGSRRHATCQTSKTRVRARLDIRTERLAHRARAARAKCSLAGLTSTLRTTQAGRVTALQECKCEHGRWSHSQLTYSLFEPGAPRVDRRAAHTDDKDICLTLSDPHSKRGGCARRTTKICTMAMVRYQLSDVVRVSDPHSKREGARGVQRTSSCISRYSAYRATSGKPN